VCVALPPMTCRRGRVRMGVVALIAAETPAVSPGLAETLAWDAERLHSAQVRVCMCVHVCVSEFEHVCVCGTPSDCSPHSCACMCVLVLFVYV